MRKYVVLATWTDQGQRNDRDTTKRGQAFASLLESLGAKLETVLWTLGHYDIVCVIDAPDDETVTAAMLKLGSFDNVRTATMRAFTSDEVDRILQKTA
ncbi:MAG TPA: GYD domain-containing protein [Candidatus Dormibacteraeota bacterium]